MNNNHTTPINEKMRFERDEIIVSKTDLKGRIEYANDVFCRVAEMSTSEVIGQPHNIIRHPDMPRAIFKLLWETLEAKKEIFAYVKNMSKTGKYYWVIAHVTPSFNTMGQLIGYHSNRRAPEEQCVKKISNIYSKLLTEERKHSNPKSGLEESYNLLQNILKNENKSYSEFVWSIGE